MTGRPDSYNDEDDDDDVIVIPRKDPEPSEQQGPWEDVD